MEQPISRLERGAEPEEMARMSLFEHLDELRRRIFRALAAVGVAFIGCWIFVDEIAIFLARPIYRWLPEGTRLAFLGITDPFVLYVKMAALAGLFVASPVVLYQAWRFIAPGLYARERRWAVPFIFFGTLFFVGGGAFAYYVAFPFAVEFLLGVGEAFQPVVTADRYYRFLLYAIFGLGVMFELPIVIFILAQVGIVTPRFLMRNFRWAVLLIFVAAAFITPTPDVVNLCLFALPTILLYLLGVAAAAVVGRLQRKREEAERAGEL
ncbi:MAG: twin-arginine translocase subunit TatC [Thermoanaerobaculia bacterium]|nr:twin-arginine translocase subunit TatC [Thermoanaerobaculia bacterium]